LFAVYTGGAANAITDPTGAIAADENGLIPAIMAKKEKKP